ncbi:MAG TPA: erythromycin esterase family protein [Acidimicrobiales bacterium]|nr:erythromycin esterase family protein [Acidimicrobiales bacterium]
MNGDGWARRAVPLRDEDRDYDDLIEAVGDARLVLLGEATHGTREFYEERARITRRLIEDGGFVAVAVEADWPDAYRVNRYVLGDGDDPDAPSALSDFRRFPSWMWRNATVAGFVEWLKRHNAAHPDRTVGFYGLDLYSLRASIEAVIAYLERADPEAAAVARHRYSCFDHVGREGSEYGRAVTLDLVLPCEDEVVAQLVELRRRAPRLLAHAGPAAEDEYFFIVQNAHLVHDAERFYRALYHGRESSWNLRDEHMVDTLDALVTHLGHRFTGPRVVVWAHNAHVGDARATQMGAAGELNVGELVRARWPGDSHLVGFTTYRGEVTAASRWGSDAERKRVRPALSGSYEHDFHEHGPRRFCVSFGDEATEDLGTRRLERAIGVVYRPDTERASHWFRAWLPGQFDSVIHLDETHAVEPLDRSSLWEAGEPPETYPTGL